jgi:hypothetical protein
VSGELPGALAGFYEIREVDGVICVRVDLPAGNIAVPDLRALIRHLTRVADAAEERAADAATREISR